eukprot:g20737.t1
MGLKAHIGGKFAFALSCAVETDGTVQVLVTRIIGTFGCCVARLGHRLGIELAGAVGGADIGAYNALEMDLHGPVAEALIEGVGCIDDHLMMELADAVAVDDGKTEAFGDEGSLRTVGASVPNHFEGRTLAELDDLAGLTGGTGVAGHGRSFPSTLNRRLEPAPAGPPFGRGQKEPAERRRHQGPHGP